MLKMLSDDYPNILSTVIKIGGPEQRSFIAIVLNLHPDSFFYIYSVLAMRIPCFPVFWQSGLPKG